jgi:hypothetical protein
MQKRLSFDELKEIARSKNVVLERERTTEFGVSMYYNLYSNTHFVGENFSRLTDVCSALSSDPNFQKEPRK